MHYGNHEDNPTTAGGYMPFVLSELRSPPLSHASPDDESTHSGLQESMDMELYSGSGTDDHLSFAPMDTHIPFRTTSLSAGAASVDLSVWDISPSPDTLPDPVFRDAECWSTFQEVVPTMGTWSSESISSHTSPEHISTPDLSPVDIKTANKDRRLSFCCSGTSMSTGSLSDQETHQLDFQMLHMPGLCPEQAFPLELLQRTPSSLELDAMQHEIHNSEQSTLSFPHSSMHDTGPELFTTQAESSILCQVPATCSTSPWRTCDWLTVNGIIGSEMPDTFSRSPHLPSLQHMVTKARSPCHGLKCHICGHTSKRRDNLRVHILTKHPKEFATLHKKWKKIQLEEWIPAPKSTTQYPSTITQPEDVAVAQNMSPDGEFGRQKIDLDCSDQRSRTVPRLEDFDATKERSLACPFQKFDPKRHQRCLKFALHRIKDVKQHLYRCHSKPNYYCATCFVEFETAEARDVHTRKRQCSVRRTPAPAQFEGLSDAQKKHLAEKSPRLLSVEDQWFKVWDFLFPQARKPSSPYLGNFLGEMIPSLRELWDRQGSMILAECSCDDMEMQKLGSVMSKLFNRLEEETLDTEEAE